MDWNPERSNTELLSLPELSLLQAEGTRVQMPGTRFANPTSLSWAQMFKVCSSPYDHSCAQRWTKWEVSRSGGAGEPGRPGNRKGVGTSVWPQDHEPSSLPTPGRAQPGDGCLPSLECNPSFTPSCPVALSSRPRHVRVSFPHPYCKDGKTLLFGLWL